MALRSTRIKELRAEKGDMIREIHRQQGKNDHFLVLVGDLKANCATLERQLTENGRSTKDFETKLAKLNKEIRSKERALDEAQETNMVLQVRPLSIQRSG
jgi:chromosome segregation ATPase